MPKNLYCPFQLFSEAKVDALCKGSQCGLWSVTFSSCSIVNGIRSIYDISLALQTLIDIINVRIPDKT